MPGNVQFSRYRVRPKRAPPALVPSCAPSNSDPATLPGPAAAPRAREDRSQREAPPQATPSPGLREARVRSGPLHVAVATRDALRRANPRASGVGVWGCEWEGAR